MKTAIQTQRTCTGVRRTIPRAFPANKKMLYLLSLEMTLKLIKLDLEDCTDDLTSLYLQQAIDDMTQAMKRWEKL